MNHSVPTTPGTTRLEPGDLVTTAEAAAILGLAEQTLCNWRWTGKGPLARRVGARAVRYLRCDLESFLSRVGGATANGTVNHEVNNEVNAKTARHEVSSATPMETAHPVVFNEVSTETTHANADGGALDLGSLATVQPGRLSVTGADCLRALRAQRGLK